MSIRSKVILITLGVAVPAFAVFPLVFPIPSDGPEMPGLALALLMALNALECLLLGAGVAFLAFGWPHVRRLVGRASPTRAVVLYLSLAWLLVNWYPHLGLHMSGDFEDAWALVRIDYAFHLPVYASLAAVVWIVLGVARDLRSGQGSSAGASRVTAG